jgi:hypothetical protein
MIHDSALLRDKYVVLARNRVLLVDLTIKIL